VPGFDLCPIPPSRDRFAYGFLTLHLFDRQMARLALDWRAGQGKSIPRD
jgi:hypothetical protein